MKKKTETEHHLFVYGTLQEPEVRRAITGETHACVAAVLEDHESFAVRGKDYPAVVEKSGSAVAGRLVLGVKRRALDALDRYEGEGYRMTGVRVTVTEGEFKGSLVGAVAYLWNGGNLADLAVGKWDLETCTNEGLAARLERIRDGSAMLPAAEAR